MEELITESESKIKIRVSEAEDVKEPRYSNIFKFKYSEGAFEIDFGRSNRIDKENVSIDIVSKIIVPDVIAFRFVRLFLKAIIDYEEEFGKELIPKDEIEE